VKATRQRGFGWLIVLTTLAVASAAGAAVVQRWSGQMAREKERQLLRVGDAFARALADYHASSPGSDKRYPPTLEQLVLDTRFVGTRRHLRSIYPDPFTGQADWVLVRDGRGNISGIHSRAEQQPWTRVPRRLDATDLPAAERYADWVFTPRQPS
jgi:type II secretory pathway pseudopilin PulG